MANAGESLPPKSVKCRSVRLFIPGGALEPGRFRLRAAERPPSVHGPKPRLHSGAAPRHEWNNKISDRPCDTQSYFHSKSCERVFPSASTSYSNTQATELSRDHFGEEL